MLLKVLFGVILTVGLAIIWESPTARKQLIDELDTARNYVNENCQEYEPWQIIAVVTGVTVLLYQLFELVFCGRESFPRRVKLWAFKQFRNFPPVRAKINQKLNSTRRELTDLQFKNKEVAIREELPKKGLTHEEVIEQLKKMDTLRTREWKKGKVSGCAYNCSDEITDLANEVYGRYCWTNPLHPTVFPEIRKMEAEIAAWCCKLFNGGPEACGSVTSGGTESILLGMRAYRELGYSRGIQYPEIIGSTATHAAFIKAADYFGMKFVPVDCDPLTRKVDLKKMRRAINRNTIVLVGNAPQYPYGVIDPIEDIAKMGLKYNIGVHVDCCLGGFILPFMDKAGYPIDPFDFRVKGVTSISADTHKYGYSPKGSSVIMYSNADLRRRQFFVATDCQIGLYASPTLAGSRPGGIIAATWATLMFNGEDGYIENTKKVVETTRFLAREIDQIPGLRVLGTPLACAMGFVGDEVNIYALNTLLCKEGGWELNLLQFPSGLHISVTVLHTKEGVAQALVSDIRKYAEMVKGSSKALDEKAVFYGTCQTLPDRSLVVEACSMFMEVCYAVKPMSNPPTSSADATPVED